MHGGSSPPAPVEDIRETDDIRLSCACHGQQQQQYDNEAFDMLEQQQQQHQSRNSSDPDEVDVVECGGACTSPAKAPSSPISSCLPLADSLLSIRAQHQRDRFGGSKAPLVVDEGVVANGRDISEDFGNIVEDASRQPEDTILHRGSSSMPITDRARCRTRTSKAVQAWPTPPYRLKVIPRRKKHKGSAAPTACCGLLGRWAFCQLGLGSLLFVWALAGATAFRYTEGPSEESAAQELVTKQMRLVTELTQELKQEINREENWYKTIKKYMDEHEQVLAEIGNGGQGKSGGHVWTFPGCVLFAVSLITTLGFGAPVPRTSEGRGVAIAFAAIGIPLHLLLVLNIGMAIAIRLQKLGRKSNKSRREPNNSEILDDSSYRKDDAIMEPNNVRHNGIFSISKQHRRSGSEPIGRQAVNNMTAQTNLEDSKEIKYVHIGEPSIDIDKDAKTSSLRHAVFNMNDLHEEEDEDDEDVPPQGPEWLKWFPFVGIFVYYAFGFLAFGVGRHQPLLEALMFPLDFTVAGGVAHTPGYVRVLYAVYLEGAVVLAAVTVAILQVSATQGLTSIGLRYGLLTNSR